MEELTQSVVNFIIGQILENGSYFPFLWIMSMMTFIVWRAHLNTQKASGFNFYDSIMIDGKASLEKQAALLGYITLTWWFIDACAKGKVGVAEAVAFGGILITARLGSKFIDMKDKQNAANTKTD